MLAFGISVPENCCGSGSPIFPSRNTTNIFVANAPRQEFSSQNSYFVPDSYSVFIFDLDLKPKATTDTVYLFLFKEDTPLSFFTDICTNEFSVNGMSWTGLLYVRVSLLLAYASFNIVKVCLHYFTGAFPLHYKRKAPHTKTYSTHKHFIFSASKSRRFRHYLARYKHLLYLQVVISPLLTLLLLCGDIHPNPGPVLPRSRRHPDAQSIITDSWNVRT